MYLVSVYFDKKTENRIQSYINDVGNSCGNTFMMDHNVPPHITITAFESLHEDLFINAIDAVLSNVTKDKIEWVTVGTFPTVIFIQPVLNEALHNTSCAIYKSIKDIPDTKVSKYYKPFSWLPHATIAKQLTKDEMRIAFDELSGVFSPFESEVVRIELAKKNPYRVIARWELK